MNAFEGFSSREQWSDRTTRAGMPARVARGLRERTSPWLLAAAPAVLCLLGFSVLSLFGGGTSRALRAHRLTPESLWRLPADARGPVSEALGAASKGYLATQSAGQIRMVNPAQGLGSTFGASGVSLRTGNTTLALHLSAITSGSSTMPFGPATPNAHANRVAYRRPGIEEWYANGPLGLEQGFTLQAAPVSHGAGPVTLALATEADAALAVGDHGQTVTFGGRGSGSLNYSDLHATDSRGRALVSWVSVRGHNILLHVRTRGATFPVHIDPLFQVGSEITAEGEVGKSHAGVYTTISRDGKTALIGAPVDNEKAGAAWVFTRTGATWKQQQELTGGAEELEKGQFGGNVALSGDGSTALVGGLLENGQRGAVWVFTRSAGKWTQQGKKLQIESKTEEENGGQFGAGMALSADGNTAIIGGQTSLVNKKTNGGGVWVFERSGETWKQQGEVLWHEGSYFGCIIRASADASTVLITACLDVPGEFGAARGTVYAYTRSNGAWHEQAKLIGEGEHNEEFGSISLSPDGNTALIGAENYNQGRGAVYAFKRTDGVWSREPTPITAPGAGNGWGFGASVALSGDAQTVFVNGHEAIWEFHHSHTGWTQVGEPAVATGSEGSGFPGALALSDDGTTLLADGVHAAGDDGAFWFFRNSPVIEHEAASEVATETARLSATVNPGGEEVIACAFEYGTTTAYTSTAACSYSPGSGEAPVPVSVEVNNLIPGTLYHFRFIATNTHGTEFGSDHEFTTLLTSATGETKEATKPAKATDGQLSVEGSGGTGQVTVGAYGSAIGGVPFGHPDTPYFQVYHSEEASFTKIGYKDCELDGAKAIWWDDPATGWEPIEEPVAVYSESPTPCITITATESTKPSIAQLADPRHVGGPADRQEWGKCEAKKGGKFITEGSGAECIGIKVGGKNKEPKPGKYEWVPDTAECMANFKHGRYSENCTKLSVNKKETKGTGTYEKVIDSFSGSGGGATFEVAGEATLACQTSHSTGALTDPKHATEVITFTGCTLTEGTGNAKTTKKCSSAGEPAETIKSEPVTVYTYEERTGKEGEEKATFYEVIGETEAIRTIMTFSCEHGPLYSIVGDVAGALTVAANKMTAGEEVSFEGEPQQPGLEFLGPQGLGHSATLAAKKIQLTNAQEDEFRLKAPSIK